MAEKNAGPSASLRMTVFGRMSFAFAKLVLGLWLEEMGGIGAMKSVGILRFAQNDGLWP
ncbi:hypothetical protein [Terriglobus sp. RCC_193]|uniref:hypothetical protein n=1 Tax=Terriglobus sp. RCC_193 TaxID=3239218 RepID=UPI003524656E